MKILWLTEFYPKNGESIIGGVQSRCYYVGKYLKADNSLRVLETVPSIFARPSLFSFLVRLVYFFNPIIQGLFTDFDIIESSNWATHIQVWIIGRLRKKPVVYWYPDVFIGTWVSKFGIVGLFGEFAERLSLLLKPDKYIAISDEVKEKLVKQGINESIITKIYCGVDLENVAKIRVDNAHKKYDLICVSRLRPYKRIQDLITAVSIIKEKKKNISLLVIGTGPERQTLEELASSLEVSENIRFVEKIDSSTQLLSQVKKSKVFCHPSVVEGFGIVLIEAAALGVPYVAANIPTILEVTRNGRGGQIFKAMDPKCLAGKIMNLLNNKVLYKRMTKEGKQLAKLYDWKKIANETAAVYESIIHSDNRLRICMIADSWSWPPMGGGEVHVWELSKELNEKYKCAVDIYAPDASLFGHIIEPNNYLGRMLVGYIIFTRILHNMRTQKYKLIHSHGYTSGLIGKIVSIISGVPCIHTVHGANNLDIGNRNAMYYLEKILLTKIKYDKEISVSSNFLRYPNVNKNIAVIPNGVDFDRFSKKVKLLNKDFFTILWVGRFDKVKGLHILVKALKILHDRKLQFKMRLVGNGSEYQNIKSMVKNLGLETSVVFVGPRFGDDLVSEYRSCDLFVLPSLSEGMPITMLEAIAAEKPVVISNVGEASNILGQKFRSLLVNPGDSQNLATNIEYLMKVKNLPLIGLALCQKAKSHFGWDDISVKTYAVYQEALR